MAKVTVIIGNPVIETETNLSDVQAYKTLVAFVDKHPSINAVTLDINNFKVICRGVTRTFKYPKIVTLSFILTKISNVT